VRNSWSHRTPDARYVAETLPPSRGILCIGKRWPLRLRRLDSRRHRDAGRCLLLPDGEFGNMHDLFIVENNLRIQLRVEPEEVIILPDDALTAKRRFFQLRESCACVL
jgi:hypothetical protein